MQFRAPAHDEWLGELRKRGVELLSFFPHAAYLVRLPAKAERELLSLSFVRAIAPWSTELRIGPWPAQTDDRVPALAQIILFDPTERELQEISSKVDVIASGRAGVYFEVRVRGSLRELRRLTDLPNVVDVEPYAEPELDDESACLITAGVLEHDPPLTYPAWLARFGYTGEAITVGVVDQGIDGTHPDLAGRVTNVLSGVAATELGYGHGMWTAGIVAGSCTHPPDADDHLLGEGAAPGASILNQPRSAPGWDPARDPNCAGLSEFPCIAKQTVTTAGTNGRTGTIQSNSWNNSMARSPSPHTYGASEQQFDRLVRDANPSTETALEPLTIVFSAGNSGREGLTRPHIAKNIITVGATAAVHPFESFSDPTCGPLCLREPNLLYCMTSVGNAQDRRIKPDVMAPGAGVTSLKPADMLFPGLDAWHMQASGTSGSAPNVAGQAAVLSEAWLYRYRRMPSPAMIKAMLVNSAVPLRRDGVLCSSALRVPASEPYPNMFEGWGLVDTRRHLEVTAAPLEYRDQLAGDTLHAAPEVKTFDYLAGEDGTPVYVTLAWTDKEAAIGANPALVNDLDLEVVTGGFRYRGNVLSGKRSTAGGSRDALNNVENVFLDPLPPGQRVAIRVRATALNDDGVPQNGDPTDQDFALVIYNGCVPTDAIVRPPAELGSSVTRTQKGWDVVVKWTPSERPTTTTLWRANDPNGPYGYVGSTPASSFTDTVLQPGKYYYIGRGFSECAVSKDSIPLPVFIP